MTMKLNTIVVAGLSSLALIPAAKADVTLVFAGGTATASYIENRAKALLSSNGTNAVEYICATNTSYIQTYTGSIGTNTALGNVTIQFSFLGSAGGMADILNQTPVPVVIDASADMSTAIPQAEISQVLPETVGYSSSSFATPLTPEIVPFLFAYNSALPNSMSTITNLTQREASLLEGASGTESLTTANLGGTSHTDWIYMVGRNVNSGTRLQTDAAIYFSGTPSFWITNSPPNAALPPIIDPAFGQDSGGAVVANLNVISNSIGTLSLNNISGGLKPLMYEGVPCNTNTVANGSYPIWAYDNIYFKASGTGAPTANQTAVLNALYSWMIDANQQATNSIFVNYYLPTSYMQVSRSSDGGPITPNNF